MRDEYDAEQEGRLIEQLQGGVCWFEDLRQTEECDVHPIAGLSPLVDASDVDGLIAAFEEGRFKRTWPYTYGIGDDSGGER